MNVERLALVLSLLMLLLVIELVRRDKLTFKYALAWMALSLIAIISAVFNETVFKLASALGFELASNFIFFAMLCAFVFLSLLLTIFLCQQNKRNDLIAQKLALLESDMNKMKGGQ